MIVVVCKVHGALTIEQASGCGKQQSTGKPRFVCKICRSLRDTNDKRRAWQREYYRKKCEQDPTYKSRKWKKYNASDPNKKQERDRAWKKKNIHIVKSIQRKYAIKSRQNLNDNYIKQLLTYKTNLISDDIPDALIKLKRVQLQIKRKLRQQQRKTT